MQDQKNLLQAAIVVVLVVIAGLLFSITRKLDSQNNAPAPAAQSQPAATPASAPAQAITPPVSSPVAATPATPAHKTAPAQIKPKPSVMAKNQPMVATPPAPAAAPP